MREKRQFFLAEQFWILYMYECVCLYVYISPIQQMELHLSPPLSVDLMICFPKERKKQYLYSEEIWQILPVVDFIVALQRCLHISPQNLWLILYVAKTDFADVIKLRTLRWGNYPGLSRRAQCNHKGPHKRDAGGFRVRKGRCDDGRRVWSHAIWRWRKVSWAVECRWPLEAGKDKETNSPLKPCQYLDSRLLTSKTLR